MEPEVETKSSSEAGRRFLMWGLAFEIGLVPLAMGIEWLFPGKPPSLSLISQLQRGIGEGILIGVGAGFVLVLLFLAMERSQWGEFQKIREILRELLGSTLVKMGWIEFLVIGFCAGLGEEALFRGVLEPRLGWVGANLLFGLLHPITVVYALLVMVAGVIFSGLLAWSGTLWCPIVAHGLYDFVVLMLLARKYRRDGGMPVESEGETGVSGGMPG